MPRIRLIFDLDVSDRIAHDIRSAPESFGTAEALDLMGDCLDSARSGGPNNVQIVKVEED